MEHAGPLPRGPFDVILADPPWEYRVSRGFQGLAAQQYATTSLDRLKQLGVREVAAPNCVLVLWATWPKIEEALAVINAWGFEHKTGFPWIKTYDGERPVNGVGWWVRGASEPILVATRGKVSPPPSQNRRIGLVGDVILSSPRGRHSAKPVEIHEFAELLTSHIGERRLELFARERRAGWSCWGNEMEFKKHAVLA